jgi:CRISPR-associated protein (TIGR02710 family)
MATVLICLVGGSPNAIVRSIEAKPVHDQVVLICSAESQASVAAIREASGLSDFKIVTLPNAQDLSGCVDTLDKKLLPLVAELRGESQEFGITVDVTGGTKCMSAALALVARRWVCTFRYIGGDSRTKDGLGVVEDTSEQVFEHANPLDLLGHDAVEDALTLCHKASYGAAADVLRTARERSSDEVVRKRLGALHQLTQALAHWDLFDFKKAKAQLERFERQEAELAATLHPASARHVMENVADWRLRLETLRKEQVSRELIEDLLANAMRRRLERRFDDAVGRLYRAIEAMAQFRLRHQHGIGDTGHVEIAKLPEKARERLASRVRANGTVALALQDDYALLLELGDEMGAKFESLGLSGIKSALQSRNRSILAHGFETVREAALEELVRPALVLAEVLKIQESALFRFPELQRRAG